MKDDTYEEIGPAIAKAVAEAEQSAPGGAAAGPVFVPDPVLMPEPVAVPEPAPVPEPPPCPPPPVIASSQEPSREPEEEEELRERRGDEPSFKLGIDQKSRVIFQSADLGDYPVPTVIILKNPTAFLQAFKIKCTDNRLFRINPPVGIIDLGETLEIKVTFYGDRVPEDDLHFLAFYHSVTKKKHLKNRQFHSMDPSGVKRILVCFRNVDGTSYARPTEEPDEDGVSERSSARKSKGKKKKKKKKKKGKGKKDISDDKEGDVKQDKKEKKKDKEKKKKKKEKKTKSKSKSSKASKSKRKGRLPFAQGKKKKKK